MAGSVGDVVRVNVPPTGEKTVNNQAVTNVQASSYIWQKWLATVRGDLSVAHNVGKQKDAEDTSAVAISGGGSVQLLPRSFFPAGFSYARSDNRTGDTAQGTMGQDIVSNVYSVNSSINLPRLVSFAGTYSWGDAVQKGLGVETNNRANLATSKSLGKQNFSIMLSRHARAFESVAGSGSGHRDDFDETRLLAGVRHSYSPIKTVNLSSSINFLKDEEIVAGVTSSVESLQGLGSAGWRHGSLPMTLNAAWRAQKEKTVHLDAAPLAPQLMTRDTTADTNVAFSYLLSKSVSANAAFVATYRSSQESAEIFDVMSASPGPVAPGAPDPGLCLDPSVMASLPLWIRQEWGACDGDALVDASGPAGGSTVLKSAELDNWIAGLSGGLSYRADPRALGGFDWRWRAAGNGGSSFGSENEEWRTNANVSMGHAAFRDVTVPFVGHTRLNLSQNVQTGLQSDSEDGGNLSLSTSGSFAHARKSEKTRTRATVSFGDSRSFGASDGGGERQNISLVLSRTGTSNSSSGWTSNLNMNWARNAKGGQGEGGSRPVSELETTYYTVSATGSAAYWYIAPFGVRNLMFRSDLDLNIGGLEDLIGVETRNKGVEEELLETHWRNQAIYRIGRLGLGLEAELFQSKGGLNYSVQFRLSRYFSNYG